MFKSKTAENQSQREHLKSSQKTKVTFTGEIIRLTDDYLVETIKTRRHCNEIIKMLNKTTCQPRIPYLWNTSFLNEYKI